MLTRIKDYLLPDAPVRIDAPSRVALFTYDNGAFVVENYRDEEAAVTISLAGTPATLREVTTGATLQPLAEPPTAPERRGPPEPARRSFRTTHPAALLPGLQAGGLGRGQKHWPRSPPLPRFGEGAGAMAYTDHEGSGVGAGVGGWLMLLVLALGVFRPLAVAVSVYVNLYADPKVALAYGSVWPAIQLFEWLLNGAMIAGCWYLVWRLNRRQVWRTVQITIAGLWLVALGYQLADMAGVSLIAGVAPERLLPFVVGPIVQSILFCTLWTAYLLRSKRVANTYLRQDGSGIAEVFG